MSEIELRDVVVHVRDQIEDLSASLSKFKSDVLEAIAGVKTDVAVNAEWRKQHDLRHEREDTWKRWVLPTLISIGSITIVFADKFLK